MRTQAWSAAARWARASCSCAPSAAWRCCSATASTTCSTTGWPRCSASWTSRCAPFLARCSSASYSAAVAIINNHAGAAAQLLCGRSSGARAAQIRKGLITADDAHAAMGRIAPSVSLEPFKRADFVFEAVSEDEELKKNVFRKLDQVRPRRPPPGGWTGRCMDEPSSRIGEQAGQARTAVRASCRPRPIWHPGADSAASQGRLLDFSGTPQRRWTCAAAGGGGVLGFQALHLSMFRPRCRRAHP